MSAYVFLYSLLHCTLYNSREKFWGGKGHKGRGVAAATGDEISLDPLLLTLQCFPSSLPSFAPTSTLFSLPVIAAENVNQQSWLGSLRLTVLGSTVDQATSRVDLQTFLYLHNPLFRSLPQAYALMWTLTSGPGGRAYSGQRLSFNNPARPAARTARPFRSRVEVFQGIFSFFSFQGFLFELQKKKR